MSGRLTDNQVELLNLARRGSPVEGEGLIDFDQLLAELSWQPTKAACHFSIRALVRRGLLAKQEALVLRRGRLRVCFAITAEGRAALDPRDAVPPAPRPTPEEKPLPDLDALLQELPEALPPLEEIAPGVSEQEWIE